jgi:hypothetical protein
MNINIRFNSANYPKHQIIIERPAYEKLARRSILLFGNKRKSEICMMLELMLSVIKSSINENSDFNIKEEEIQYIKTGKLIKVKLQI